jgi:tetratricopeptide (TPR) repeat protein
VLSIVAVFMAAAPIAASELVLPKATDHWVEVRTSHFRFFSNAGRSTTRRVAVDLEELRAVLAELTDYELQSPVTTAIYIFNSERSFGPYKSLYQGKPAEVNGYFTARGDANYIAIDASSRDASAVVFHEYVHYVAATNMWFLPLWFSEGLAEFYESFDVVGDTVFIGLPVAHHLRWLRGSTPIPLSELFTVDRDSPLYNESDRRGSFYAQSWALVHYLLLGDDERRGQLGRYVAMVRNGMPEDEAFGFAFATDYEGMARDLRAHLRSPRLPYIETRAEFDVDAFYEVRELSYADVLYRLGELLSNHDPDRPERVRYFEEAVEVDPEHAGALSALALESERRADWSTANTLYERAAAAGTDDPVVLFRWGRFLSRRGGSQKMAIDLLRRSTRLDPSFGPAWAELAKVYADTGVISDEALTVARIAHGMQPSDVVAARNLLQLYLRRDLRQEAVALVEEAFSSLRAAQARAWMMVVQYDTLKARELLQADRPEDAARRLDLAEQIAERTAMPEVSIHDIETSRRSIVEHQAASLYERAQQLYELDDVDGARMLLTEALDQIDDGPVAFSCRQLLDVIDYPNRFDQSSELSQISSPTPDEIEQFNRLLGAGDFESALRLLEEMRTRTDDSRRPWLDGKIREIQSTLAYNSFVEAYNHAIDLYNADRFDEAVTVLETLLTTLDAGPEANTTRALLEDARNAAR